LPMSARPLTVRIEALPCAQPPPGRVLRMQLRSSSNALLLPAVCLGSHIACRNEDRPSAWRSG
jgi:hypothetical protein